MRFIILVILAFYGLCSTFAHAHSCSINAAKMLTSYPYPGSIKFSTLKLTVLGDSTPQGFTQGTNRDSELMQLISADSLPVKNPKILWSNVLAPEERPITIDLLNEKTKISLPDDFSQNRNIAFLYKSIDNDLAPPRPFYHYSQKKKIFLPLGLFWFLKQKF